jgi:predicted lipoprotein with Yx(FWY)xxD motif
MKRVTKFFIFSSLVAALSGCGTGTNGAYPNIVPNSTPTSGTGRNSAGIGVANGHLVDASGFALYVTASACTGSCLTVWPPDQASAAPPATGGLTQSLIGLKDGQVTYKSQPLYYFESDTSSGLASGNGVEGFSLATP